MDKITELLEGILIEIHKMSLEDKIDAINSIRKSIHKISPFKSEPVDFVEWVPADIVKANDYNPNSVAPKEMDLLKLSIQADGYTQPIVSMPEEKIREVIDGFHRHLVGKNDDEIKSRVMGYLPLVTIKSDRRDKEDRMAATIRHNRARGKHKVESMSEIVVHLKRRKWSDKKIATHLGMDQDEVLRLSQISGLSEMFKDKEFSQAWEAIPEDIEETIIEDETKQTQV